jgi:small conductance mechanosensitive channel
LIAAADAGLIRIAGPRRFGSFPLQFGANMQNAKQVAINFVVQYGFQIVGALFILAGGFFLAKWIGNLLMRTLMRREMEPPVRTLIVRIVRLVIFGLTMVIALDKFGVPVTSLIAGIGVAGVGVGLAMQGVLGNLIAGLFIIIVKPFRVGEYVELLGVQGEVRTIELFSTVLLHPDRSRVVVPNRKIVGEILHNFGTMRQFTLKFSVAYNTNISQAIALIREVVVNHPRVIKDPTPGVGISEFGDSAIVLSVSPWVAVKDYGAAQGELNQSIFQRLLDAKITMPFPQHEIRILNDTIPFQTAQTR